MGNCISATTTNSSIIVGRRDTRASSPTKLNQSKCKPVCTATTGIRDTNLQREREASKHGLKIAAKNPNNIRSYFGNVSKGIGKESMDENPEGNSIEIRSLSIKLKIMPGSKTHKMSTQAQNNLNEEIKTNYACRIEGIQYLIPLLDEIKESSILKRRKNSTQSLGFDF